MDDLHLLVNEAGRHAAQMRDGRYVFIDQPITPADLWIQRQGFRRVATTVTAEDGSCRFIALDDDSFKHREETADVIRGVYTQVLIARSVLEQVAPPHSIMSFHSGGEGGWTILPLDREPVARVLPVVEALQASIGTVLGVPSHKFEGFPSSEAPASASRVLGLPGCHQQKGRFSRILLHDGAGWRPTPVNALPRLGVRPLEHHQFEVLERWAKDRIEFTRSYFERRIRERRTRARTLERPALATPYGVAIDLVAEHCEVFDGILREVLRADAEYGLGEAVFAASIAAKVGAPLRLIGRDTGRGYARQIFDEYDSGRAMPAMSCQAAQRRYLCGGDCPARIMTGIRSPADLRHADRVHLRHRLATERGIGLAEARVEHHAALFGAIEALRFRRQSAENAGDV